MISNIIMLTGGPGLAAIVYGACLWVLGMLVLLFHREGIKVVGLSITLVGVLVLLAHPQILLSCGLIVFGLTLRWFGQMLINLKRRG